VKGIPQRRQTIDLQCSAKLLHQDQVWDRCPIIEFDIGVSQRRRLCGWRHYHGLKPEFNHFWATGRCLTVVARDINQEILEIWVDLA